MQKAVEQTRTLEDGEEMAQKESDKEVNRD